MPLMRLTKVVAFVVLITLVWTAAADPTYNVSMAGGLGRRFDGIGGLSGGGCSTRLLADYSAVWYNQILDYLFLPGFGASLQILKVEIGGDVQSTDGTEPSHMHSADDENYERGYEWTIMVEAKRRNPNITLYGLSWGFPGWVGEGANVPWTNSTVAYTMKWILGAKKYYNLDIDYIGIWNERSWNKVYTLSLKAAITAAGLKTKIVGHDSKWDVCNDLSNDPEWAAAVDVIGAHYPAAGIQTNCAALNKVQWASEDMAVSWDTGARCWARELNQNYVRANLTATIAWDLVNSFYDNLEFAGAGLLRAVEPWSGFFQVGQVIWAAAHWTQFTTPGWFFLQHGTGVGLLDNGGSYVALTDSTGLQLTIIVETMKRDNSQCRFSTSIVYNTTEQTATFELDQSFAHITQLFVFYSNFSTTDVNQAFMYNGTITLNNRAFTLQLPVEVFYTLSTINGTKGAYKAPPASTPFPLPYQDDFNQYPVFSEAALFADQSGSWQIIDTFTSRGRVMRQMITEVPISWCKEAPYPYSIIGDPIW
jgi:galactosylceramidase